jgi:hypothetical protein
MPPLPNAQHEKFCQEYVRGAHAGNLTAAYGAAGYTSNRANASRFANQKHIQDRIFNLALDDTEIILRPDIPNRRARLAAIRYALARKRKALEAANILDYLSSGPDGSLRLDLVRLQSDDFPLAGFEFHHQTLDGTPRTQMRLYCHAANPALVELGRSFRLWSEQPLDEDDDEPCGDCEACEDGEDCERREDGEEIVTVRAEDGSYKVLAIISRPARLSSKSWP